MKRRSQSDRAIIAAVNKGYRADIDGRVFDPNGKEMKGHGGLRCGNHLRLTVYVDGVNDRGYASVLMHRLAAYYFFGAEVFEHRVIRHLNDNAEDNRPENLKPGSYKENRADIPLEKISLPSKKHAHKLVARSRKLTDGQVLEMREERSENKTPYKKLARMFGVTAMTAHRAVNGKSWGEVK